MLCRYRCLDGSLAAVVASWADAWPPIAVLFGSRQMLCRLGGCFATLIILAEALPLSSLLGRMLSRRFPRFSVLDRCFAVQVDALPPWL